MNKCFTLYTLVIIFVASNAITLLQAQYAYIWDVVDDIRTEPLVVFKDEPFKIMVKSKVDNIKRIWVVNPSYPWSGGEHFEDEVFNSIELNDGGILGDDISNDNIFTRGGFNFKSNFIQKEGLWLTYVAEYNNGSIDTLATNVEIYPPKDNIHIMSIWYIGDEIEIPRINLSSNNTQYTDYVFNIKTDPIPMPFESRDNLSIYYQAIDTFYTYFGDDYDFIYVFRPLTNGTVSFHHTVQNDVQGIGLPVFGSFTNKINSLIVMSPVHENQLQIFAHELNHRWSSFLTSSELNLGNGTGHWNPTIVLLNDSVKTTAQGPPTADSISIEADNCFGLHYRAFDDGQRANSLELYLMGLIPIEEIGFPIVYVKNPEYKDRFYNDDGTRVDIYLGTDIDTIFQEKILEIYGERVPNYTESQKHFKIATILLHDRLLTAKELAPYERMMKRFEQSSNSDPFYDRQPFEYLTFNLMSITTRLTDDPVSSVVNQNLDAEHFKIYPNPSDGFLNIKVERDIVDGNSLLLVHSISGQEIISEQLLLQKEFFIDLQKYNLEQGSYVVTLKNDSFVESQKILLTD